MTQKATLQLSLTVDLDLNGASLDEIKNNLNYIVENAINNAMVTQDSEAEIDDYQFSVDDLTRLIDEDDATKMIGELIDEGEIDVETLPRKLARYGLSKPSQFSDEIKERYNDINVDVTIDYPQPPDFKP